MAKEIIYKIQHTDDIEEIITAVPSWILKWGITLIFLILLSMLIMSGLIKYPDIIKTTLKINSLNSPKAVLAKQGGKLTSLLVKDGQIVKENQALAYFESTANPTDVLQLNKLLKRFQNNLLKKNNEILTLPDSLNLGELQSSYQTYYEQFLQYQATLKNGYYLNKVAFLERDLKDIGKLKLQIINQKKIQQLEFSNQEIEYNAYQKLYKNKVISRSEFSEQENKYLTSKYPLQQSETEVLNNRSVYSEKEKELLDIKHTIAEERAKFIQSLNQCITESDAWISLHILTAPVAGKLIFAGIIQKSQNVTPNQEIFIINPGSTTFFGEVQIPQYNMGKIRKGQRTLVKLRSYPFEQYGMVRGEITDISDVAYRDSIFLIKVNFNKIENKDTDHKIILKNGMAADAEIITEESSLLQRFVRNITKTMHSQ